jgi:hypothetical protein
MTTNGEGVACVCEQLTPRVAIEDVNPGDTIEAGRDGHVVHRGTVTDVAPHLGLLWIMDSLTGGRRLVDTAELSISHAPSTTLAESTDTEAPAA